MELLATATATAMPGFDSPVNAASNTNAGTSQETAAMMVKYGMLKGSESKYLKAM